MTNASIASTSTSTSTIIVIPGREDQTIPGLVMNAADIRSAFAGDIDLSSMTDSTNELNGVTTVTFANRTGTKGNDIYIAGDLNLSVEGDVIINNTRIEIPGREAQVIPGLVMASAEVRAAFASDIDLSGLECAECVEGDTAVITFSNRTGTKGQTDLLAAIFAAVESRQLAVDAEEEAEEEEEHYEEEEYEDLTSTRIVIPGREDQFIQGIVLDAQMVKDSFSGEIDLSGYDVEEIEYGNVLEVRFTARTGTKGEA